MFDEILCEEIKLADAISVEVFYQDCIGWVFVEEHPRLGHLELYLLLTV